MAEAEHSATQQAAHRLLADERAIKTMGQCLANAYSTELGGVPLASLDDACGLAREMLEAAARP